MIEEIELRTEALINLLGEKDDRLPRLTGASPRCLDGVTDPCWLCPVQDQVARTQWPRTAQVIAEICCPEGKMPAILERKLAAIPR